MDNNKEIQNFIFNRLKRVSEEWHQEGMYCDVHLKNSDKAEVWFTVSEYLCNLIEDIKYELGDLNYDV